ncbi:arsenite methyltransferase [Miltoncostaea marina]|uniref:arsenite methyltransferase n=1 Tax=Miltoncostaea marina TaxID=2843215 RepID=UPI001C3D6648|nr:arsenite methyltransferase [Miltoncostaea marina]
MSATGDVRDEVRARYAAAARRAASGGGCDEGACCGDPAEAAFGGALYGADERDALPGAAVLASLGCGNPTAVAELREGETVLDLGSGGGIDVLLSARRVGPAGRVYGLDMTEEMLALARRAAADAGAANIVFLKGHIEQIPLPAETVDVVISNCVVNLSPDKPAVLAEAFRVLRPGGRVGIADVVAEDGLSAAERVRRGSWAGCIAGALGRGEYERLLAASGFEAASVEFTHAVADGLHGAIVRARKPAAAPSVLAGAGAAPGGAGEGCCA